ncbi:Ger(x)C family spore germination protein [Paenibacillus sp. Soil750]|uniref:Ger(x)C family spore germination protein n=1 Tax=Paenibacillus sp. Soil750 TaxID=1736398 RepID=UPI0006F58393|nr:Ger(x)C family spore germination protein [Paenibacillus sp. Soil750]KRE64763.1 hypothetical protein ASL11_22140 [Paenibacillus sp. Soil750]
MKRTNLYLILCSISLFLAGCTQDRIEISDIALVTATGIDYDLDKNRYVFTAYCLLPSSKSTDKTSGLSEWVASATGISILDSAKNLRSRAGKTLTWQHNKYILVGENAARHSLYEILDFITRNRQVRLTSYLFINDGNAADVLNLKSETGDLLFNDLQGKVRNEKEWGKSISQIIQDVANWSINPYRGYVVGRLSTSKQSKSSEVLYFNGAAVINKDKMTDWLKGSDVLVVHLLAEKKKWNSLIFNETIPYNSNKVTLFFKVKKKFIQSNFVDGKPSIDIHLDLTSTIGEIAKPLPFANPDTIDQLEQEASKVIEKLIQKSLNHLQKELKVDVLGFSELFKQHHPYEWNRIKNNWNEIYPTIPIQTNVHVAIEKIGLIQNLGENGYVE